jgi:hypothetical protein
MQLPTIEEIDERTNELLREITLLEGIRALLQPVATPSKEYWFARSRTGNSYGHSMTIDRNGVVECGCPAGENGRTCWAAKGLGRHRFHTPVGGTFDFYDEKFDYRSATRVS